MRATPRHKRKGYLMAFYPEGYGPAARYDFHTGLKSREAAEMAIENDLGQWYSPCEKPRVERYTDHKGRERYKITLEA